MYFYHGYALGVASTLDTPFQEVGGSDAVCSPASSGGSASAQQEKSNLEGLVSFDSAHTDISWSKEIRDGKHVYVTHASAVIKGLNIADKFVADRVATRLVAEYSPEDSPESTIVVTGSHFENLLIAGRRVEVEYTNEPHPAKVLEERKNERPHIGLGIDLGARLPDQIPRDLGRVVQLPRKEELKSDVSMYSFVKKVHGIDEDKPGDITRRGSVIVVPQFGTIHLGEAVVCSNFQMVNMFRLELESSKVGAVVGGSLIASSSGDLIASHAIRGLSSRPSQIPPTLFGQEKVAVDRYGQVKAQYELLVDQKYLRGLSPAETKELHRLESLLDEMDAPYYEQTMRNLRAILPKEDTRL